MPDRSAKRLRRLSTDYDDSEGGNDWASDRHTSSNHHSAAPTASSTRPRRNAARDPPAALIQRSSPEESRQSIHLTVKASPGKIRQATRGQAPATSVSSRNIVAGKRSSRNSRVVQEVDSDEDDEDDEGAEEVEAMDVDEDEEEEDDEDDAEGDEDEDMDAEGDEEDEIEVTPAPRIVVSTNKSVPVKPSVAQDSVEAKELTLDDDDDDEELSELESEEEDAEGEDEDAEGEDEDETRVAIDEDEDEEMESDEDMSRDDTPDLSKMTRRQQAMVTEGTDELMSLSNEAQKKKHLTAEEHAMRRAEMARRRKNLSEKRNEEEKMDTINRLLKKQPPKRGRKSLLEPGDASLLEDEQPEVEKANPLYTRYIQNRAGTSLGVPQEWVEADATADVLKRDMVRPKGGAATGTWAGLMVQEVA